MKKLINLSAIILTIAAPGVAFASQGIPLNELEVEIVFSAVCNLDLSRTEILEKIEEKADRFSLSSRKEDSLKEMAEGFISLSSEEKSILCE